MSETNFAISALTDVLQVNVALGILYIGLKRFRLRNELYAKVVRTVNENNFGDISQSSDADSLFRTDREFSEAYHKIVEWIRELPINYQNKLKNINENLLQPEDAARTRTLPLRHRWILSGGDRIAVWLLTLLLSMAGVWLAPFGYGSASVACMLFVFSIIGISTLIYSVGLIWWIRKKDDRLIQGPMSLVQEKHTKEKAAQAANSVDSASSAMREL